MTFNVPSDDDLVIRTARLTLRPVRPDDAPEVFEHARDPETPRLMTWAPHRDPGETKAFLASSVAARCADRDYVWTIREGGVFRGVVGIESVRRAFAAVRFDRAELGYWLGAPYRRRGLMTEAAAAATDFAFRRLGLHKVAVCALAQNAASLGVIRKLGFTLVGVARRDVLRDGVWHDHVKFEMLEGDPAAAALQRIAAPSR